MHRPYSLSTGQATLPVEPTSAPPFLGGGKGSVCVEEDASFTLESDSRESPIHWTAGKDSLPRQRLKGDFCFQGITASLLIMQTRCCHLCAYGRDWQRLDASGDFLGV